ncbi:Uncharacterized protein APZ42_004373 [Daphnia magna]|uniref:Uncharacterized protein n=1 Tax=Daphnia magna TaxID=35525 RepID=A0A164H3N4_9CRUS|nr:Uncharacterized protein APZ42_004373 [Daphnia magna]
MAQLAHGYQELPSWFSDLETSIVKSFQLAAEFYHRAEPKRSKH